MFNGLPSPRLKADEQSLLEAYQQLDSTNKETLLAFADFLAQRHVSTSEAESTAIAEPNPIERPENESVIKAIKRLSTTYPMVEKGKMLDTTSQLMSDHILNGRLASDVIDELEALFAQYYTDLQQAQNK